MRDQSICDTARRQAVGKDFGEPSEQWIVDLVRARFGLSRGAAPRALDHLTEHDWKKVEDLLQVNRFWTLCSEAALCYAPLKLQLRHQREVARLKLFNLRVLTATGQVLPAMADKGIKALVMKGPLQQERVFGSPFMRASTDVDLWVRPFDRHAAHDVLESQSYVKHADCDSLWWDHFLGEAHYIPAGAGLCQLDLHHNVHQAGLPSPARPELFFATAVVADRYSSKVWMPSPAYAFLITCMAIAKGLLAREAIGHHALEIVATCREGGCYFREAMWAAAKSQRMERLAGLAITLCEQAFAIDLQMRQAPFDGIDGPTAHDLVLSTGRRTWSRQRTMWAVTDGILPVRASGFAANYSANIAGQVCRAVLHAPAMRPTRNRDRKVSERDRPVSDPPNPNSA